MSRNQSATLPAQFIGNGKNLQPEKEVIRAYTVIGIGKSRSDVDELATVRCYMARSGDGASPVYASVWIHNRCAGHGRANGYGYHKSSAAIQAALSSAGVKLAERIDGCGDRAITDALHAVGIAMGYNTVRVFQAV